MKSLAKAGAFVLLAALLCWALLPGKINLRSAWPLGPRYNAGFGIKDIVSSVDKVGDGVDDQSDILAGAKAYVATEPTYKSAYYDGGYPTDGYGVCTDVVAQGLLAAGYDLRALVNADIRQAPEAYGGITPDSNIDFRRVVNLRVYFSRHAVALTTDLDEIDQWQGGDIVIFRDHIGIVSDKRNNRGVPYLIHHYSTHQKTYEENTLSHWGEIYGHYRVST